MLRNLSNLLHRVSSGWVTIVSLLIFLLFSALVLPVQAPESDAVTADAGTPDLSFFYSADDLYRMASSYGEEGREAYIRARFTFDLIWPLVYGFFLTMTISWTSRKAFSPLSRWQMANVVPVAGVLFDYLENISTSVVMARYPTPTAGLDWLASVFTMLKWVFIAGSFGLLVVGILTAVVRRVSRSYMPR